MTQRPTREYSQRVKKSQENRANGSRSPLKWGFSALLIGAGFALGTLAYTYLATHPPRRKVRLPGSDSDLLVEEVEFESRDGVRLSGWFLAAEEACGAVILCHGYPANRAEVLPWARLLYEAGFHVLLFDFRAMGQSGGKLSTIGYHEVNDLLGASDYLHSRPEMDGLKAGVFGLSMGGAVALMAAAQDTRLSAIVTHGAYATLERAIDQRGRAILGKLGKVVSRPAMWWGQRLIAINPREVSPVEAIRTIPLRPMLFFHGQRDFIVNPQDGVELAHAINCPDALRRLPRSFHVRVHPDEWQAYREEFVAFFLEHL
jgi:uncharacterized protein